MIQGGEGVGKLWMAAGSALLVVLAWAGLAAAQTMEVEPSVVAEAGETGIEVSLSGFSADIALFVLPCEYPADGDPASLDVTTCDQANLTPVVMDADGAGTVTVTYDIPAEGIAIIAGDAAQTESAVALVSIGDVPTMTLSAAGVSQPGEQTIEVTLSGFSAEIPLFVLPCDYPADGNPASLDVTTCDQANLTPVVMDADGAGAVTVTYDIPAEGIAVIAGDAAQTESARALLPVVQTAMTVSPDAVGAAGSQEIEVSLSGFSAEIPLFVLPCDHPAGGDLAALDVTTCDQANLTPVVMDADGAGAVTVTYDVPAEGIAIIAGDAAQTQSAVALVSIDESLAEPEPEPEPEPAEGETDTDETAEEEEADEGDGDGNGGSGATVAAIAVIAVLAGAGLVFWRRRRDSAG